jgi:hypothetical protein
LAQFIASAISKDEEVMKEIAELLPTTVWPFLTLTLNMKCNPCPLTEQELQSMPSNHKHMDTHDVDVSLSSINSGPVPLDLGENYVD